MHVAPSSQLLRGDKRAIALGKDLRVLPWVNRQPRSSGSIIAE
jgi:hypothetical protein